MRNRPPGRRGSESAVHDRRVREPTRVGEEEGGRDREDDALDGEVERRRRPRPQVPYWSRPVRSGASPVWSPIRDSNAGAVDVRGLPAAAEGGSAATARSASRRASANRPCACARTARACSRCQRATGRAQLRADPRERLQLAARRGEVTALERDVDPPQVPPHAGGRIPASDRARTSDRPAPPARPSPPDRTPPAGGPAVAAATAARSSQRSAIASACALARSAASRSPRYMQALERFADTLARSSLASGGSRASASSQEARTTRLGREVRLATLHRQRRLGEQVRTSRDDGPASRPPGRPAGGRTARPLPSAHRRRPAGGGSDCRRPCQRLRRSARGGTGGRPPRMPRRRIASSAARRIHSAARTRSPDTAATAQWRARSDRWVRAVRRAAARRHRRRRGAAAPARPRPGRPRPRPGRGRGRSGGHRRDEIATSPAAAASSRSGRHASFRSLQHVGDHRHREVAADDGRGLEQPDRLRGQPRQPRTYRLPDAGGHRPFAESRRVASTSTRPTSVDVERVAARCGRAPARRRDRTRARPTSEASWRPDVGAREAADLQSPRRRQPSSPASRTSPEGSVSRWFTSDEQSLVGHGVREMLQEQQGGGIGPVRVVEDDQERAIAGQQREAVDRPRRTAGTCPPPSRGRPRRPAHPGTSPARAAPVGRSAGARAPGRAGRRDRRRRAGSATTASTAGPRQPPAPVPTGPWRRPCRLRWPAPPPAASSRSLAPRGRAPGADRPASADARHSASTASSRSRPTNRVRIADLLQPPAGTHGEGSLGQLAEVAGVDPLPRHRPMDRRNPHGRRPWGFRRSSQRPPVRLMCS